MPATAGGGAPGATTAATAGFCPVIGTWLMKAAAGPAEGSATGGATVVMSWMEARRLSFLFWELRRMKYFWACEATCGWGRWGEEVGVGWGRAGRQGRLEPGRGGLLVGAGSGGASPCGRPGAPEGQPGHAAALDDAVHSVGQQCKQRRAGLCRHGRTHTAPERQQTSAPRARHGQAWGAGWARAAQWGVGAKVGGLGGRWEVLQGPCLSGGARDDKVAGDGAPVALAVLGQAHEEQAVLLLRPGDALAPLGVLALHLQGSGASHGGAQREWGRGAEGSPGGGARAREAALMPGCPIRILPGALEHPPQQLEPCYGLQAGKLSGGPPCHQATASQRMPALQRPPSSAAAPPTGPLPAPGSWAAARGPCLLP